MKKLSFLIAIAALVLCSCKSGVADIPQPVDDNTETSNTQPGDGNEPAIELDKAEVCFPADGGVDNVMALNYDSWIIDSGYESAEYINGKWEYTHYVSANPLSIDGGWYHAVVPDGQKNLLVITVDLNPVCVPRHAYILMTVGDSFSCVKISQELNENHVGDWPDIELDKTELNFPVEGGVETVTELNYQGWWIDCGYEYGEYVNGKWEFTNYVEAELINTLDGGWYHAVVTEDNKKQLIITVDPNTTGQPRQATIEMSVGDAFTKIPFYQQ